MLLFDKQRFRFRHTPSMYPISPASTGFRSPYPTSLPITSSSLPRLVGDRNRISQVHTNTLISVTHYFTPRLSTSTQLILSMNVSTCILQYTFDIANSTIYANHLRD